MARVRQLRSIGKGGSKILTIPKDFGQIDDYVELEIIDSNNLLITIVDLVNDNEQQQQR